MVDKYTKRVYYILVRERNKPLRKGGQPMDKAKKEALQELLKILSDCPEIAERITITIKPNSKPQQGERQET